jgi:hypothetical protein
MKFTFSARKNKSSRRRKQRRQRTRRHRVQKGGASIIPGTTDTFATEIPKKYDGTTEPEY